MVAHNATSKRVPSESLLVTLTTRAPFSLVPLWPQTGGWVGSGITTLDHRWLVLGLAIAPGAKLLGAYV